MKIAKSLIDLIGNTPLVELQNYNRINDTHGTIVAKLESQNPCGSVKDRVGIAMITDAEERGVIKPGATIIEPTSGNTGIGLAMAAKLKGYKLLLTMPETMSIERRKILSALGAEIVLTDGSKGMVGAISRSEELVNEIPNSLILKQFENPSNAEIHFKTTAEEIWKDTDGSVAYFIGGVGTGGTINGIGRGLKEHNPNVQIIAVEPADSPVLSGGKAGAHKIQGIGAGFIPKILDLSAIDEVISVSTEQAYSAARELSQNEAILAGISGGAALYAATVIAKRVESKGKCIVVLIPDGGEKYLSTELYL